MITAPSRLLAPDDARDRRQRDTGSVAKLYMTPSNLRPAPGFSTPLEAAP